MLARLMAAFAIFAGIYLPSSAAEPMSGMSVAQAAQWERVNKADAMAVRSFKAAHNNTLRDPALAVVDVALVCATLQGAARPLENGTALIEVQREIQRRRDGIGTARMMVSAMTQRRAPAAQVLVATAAVAAADNECGEIERRAAKFRADGRKTWQAEEKR